MSPAEADEKLPYVFLLINEDGEPSLIKKDDLPKYYSIVEDGTHHIVRVLSFSEEARNLSGKAGRAEYMLAESTVEDDPEEAGEDEIEVEGEVEWAIEWEAL